MTEEDGARPSRDPVWRESARAAVLALMAGYVGCYSLLCYGTFASFMSGNTTKTGLSVGGGRLGAAGHNLLPIPLFVVGVFAGTCLLHSGLRQRGIRGSISRY